MPAARQERPLSRAMVSGSVPSANSNCSPDPDTLVYASDRLARPKSSPATTDTATRPCAAGNSRSRPGVSMRTVGARSGVTVTGMSRASEPPARSIAK